MIDPDYVFCAVVFAIAVTATLTWLAVAAVNLRKEIKWLRRSLEILNDDFGSLFGSCFINKPAQPDKFESHKPNPKEK
jgi:hypothetical protein